MRKLYLFAFVLLIGCGPDDGPARFPAGTVQGFRPIYTNEETFSRIEFVEDMPLSNPGKIFNYGKFLLVNESSSGVHIYDNEDPTLPIHLGFITIPGNQDIALQGNILYADHGVDLIALDLSDPTNPEVVDRREDIYRRKFSLPPGQDTYFECVDAARSHLVIGWEFTTLDNPECYR